MDLEEAYRLYASRLYTYARGILGDGESAADVVHDTFLAADRHWGQLRDPERLRPWLYAIARRESLRQLKRRSRMFPLDTLDARGDTEADPLTSVRSAEIVELVWAAYGGLSAPDREIVELSVRHGLSAVDIATALDVSIKHANARISRARAQISVALGVLLVARSPSDCAELGELLRGWDGQLTVLLRKRLHRHIDSCLVCGAQRKRRMDPVALLSGYASAGFLVFTEPRRADPPLPPPNHRLRNTIVLAVLLILFIAVPVAASRGLNQNAAPEPSGALPMLTEPGDPPLAAPSDTGSPAPSESAEPVWEPPPSPGPSLPRLTAVVNVRCAGAGQYVIATQVNSLDRLSTARLRWRIGVQQRQVPLTVKLSKVEATGTGSGLSTTQLRWWVEATTEDGDPLRTDEVIARNPCASPSPPVLIAP
jgi:RNA polymerase sigma factor (sigma-70 family)